MRKDFQGRRDSPSARPCELVQGAGSPGTSGPQGSCVADPRERSVSTQPCLLSKPLCPKWDIRSSHLPWPLPPLLPPGDRDKAAQVWKRPQKRPHTFPFQAEEKAVLSHSSPALTRLARGPPLCQEPRRQPQTFLPHHRPPCLSCVRNCWRLPAAEGAVRVSPSIPRGSPVRRGRCPDPILQMRKL